MKLLRIVLGAALLHAPLALAESLFAEVGDDGVVVRVLVIEQKEVDSGKWGSPGRWVRTTVDGSIGKNYSGTGYSYDKASGAFIPPKPDKDAILDTKTYQWVVPEGAR